MTDAIVLGLIIEGLVIDALIYLISFFGFTAEFPWFIDACNLGEYFHPPQFWSSHDLDKA